MKWSEWIEKWGEWTEKYARTFRVIGYIGLVAYGVARAIPLFTEFNLGRWDITIFFVIDFATVATQIYCMEKFFQAEGLRGSIVWSLGVLGSFFAPYIFAMARGESPSENAYIIAVAIIIFAAAVTVLKERKRLKARLSSRSTAAPE